MRKRGDAVAHGLWVFLLGGVDGLGRRLVGLRGGGGVGGSEVSGGAGQFGIPGPRDHLRRSRRMHSASRNRHTQNASRIPPHPQNRAAARTGQALVHVDAGRVLAALKVNLHAHRLRLMAR